MERARMAEATFRTARRCSGLPQSDPRTGSSAVDFQELVTRCTTLGFAAVKVNVVVSRSCTRPGLHAPPRL